MAMTAVTTVVAVTAMAMTAVAVASEGSWRKHHRRGNGNGVSVCEALVLPLQICVRTTQCSWKKPGNPVES